MEIKIKRLLHIGPIRTLFRDWRILICAWVDDNSPLKSQFFGAFKGDDGTEYIKIGIGFDRNTQTAPRMAITRWSIRGYIRAHGLIPVVWFGLGKFIDDKADKEYIWKRSKTAGASRK